MKLVNVASVLALVAVPLVACSSAAPENTEASGEAIQDGTSDSGDPAVVLLYRAPGTQGSSDHGSFCTGTLIAPDLVLTAAHCFVAPAGLPSGMTTVYLGAGSPESYLSNGDVPAPPSTMTAIGIHDYKTHPQYSTSATITNDPYDVAVVLLARGSGVSPVVPYATSSSDEPPAGATGTAIGYGWHGPQGSETILEKRTASEQVSVAPTTAAPMYQMTYGSGLAGSGDSGGPLLYNGKIVATVAGHFKTGGVDPWPAHYTEYYVPTAPVAGWIASTVSSLTAECENQMCETQQQCVNAGDGSTCLCLAWWYNCRRKLCGESLPIISCRF